MTATLLLHGFTGAPDAWADVIARLDIGPKIYAPVLAGHGPHPVPATSFRAEVERLCDIAAAELGAGVHLVGYSLGARVALGMLVAHPERFARATLIGVNPGMPDGPDKEARRDRDERWARRLEHGGIQAFVDEWERLPLWTTQTELPAETLAAQRATRMSHDPVALAGAMRALGLAEMPDYTPALSELDVDVTLVAGAEDEKFSAIAARMATRLPRGRAVTVDGAGHNVVLERPAAVAELLEAEGRSGPA